MILLCNFFPEFTITVITKAQKQKSLIDVLKKAALKISDQIHENTVR